MESILKIFPIKFVPEDNIVSTIIQVVALVIIIGMIIYMIRLYFKNMELKSDLTKNEAEFKENMDQIEKMKKMFLKVGGIIFAILIIFTIIIMNWY